MVTPTILTFLALGAANFLQAQSDKPQGLTSQPNQTDSAITAETRHVFQTVTDNILKSAREMPPNKYSFRPANGARTFGELVAHIANVQGTLCSNINGHPVREASMPALKDSIIKDLENSAAECEIAFGELSAQNVSVPVQTPVGQLTHWAALLYIVTHASEEYGQLAIYLRLNQLAPPATDQPKSAI